VLLIEQLPALLTMYQAEPMVVSPCGSCLCSCLCTSLCTCV
jgi:hypothetical protein